MADAAHVGALFGRLPDEVLDCDQTTWQIRLAGATAVYRAREAHARKAAADRNAAAMRSARSRTRR